MSERLRIILDRIVPPEPGHAGAGALGLAAQIASAISEPVIAALPPGFESWTPEAQVAALQRVEQGLPAAFAALVAAVYTAYYTDPRVLAAIEQASGYPARPPQPQGYEVEPLDDTLLDGVRRRAKGYRH